VTFPSGSTSTSTSNPTGTTPETPPSAIEPPGQRPAWYTELFTELPNALWRAAIPPQVTAAEVDFLERVGLPATGAVLDVPCGSGRHALELARRGHRVCGVDVSVEAIDFARAAAAAEGLTLDLRVGDMADLEVRDSPTNPPFDLVVCLGNAFGYLEHDDTRRFLAQVHALTAPGGAIVIDTGFVAESFLPGLVLEEEPMTIDGIEMISVNRYDPRTSRFVTDMTFRRGNEEHVGTSVQHVYTSAEIARLVVEAGFERVEMYGAVDGSAYQWGDRRLLLVARAAAE